MSRPLRYILATVVCLMCALQAHVALADDPAVAFIGEADAIARADGDDALSRYILDNRTLLGAAVGQLLDVAIEVGDAGDKAGEAENVAFAVKIASLYKDGGGSAAPLALASTYEGWSAEQRARRTRARELETKAVAARDGSDFAGADALFIEAKAIYDEIGDARSTAITWGSMGVNAWYAGDFESVLSYYGEALAAREAIDDQILVGKTLNGLGSANRVTGELEAAVDWYTRAVELRRQTRDIDGFTKSVTYLSAVYLEKGRLYEARTTMEEAVPLLAEAGDATEVINAHTQIGNIYSGMGDYTRANQEFDKAYALSMDAGDSLRAGIALNNSASNLLLNFRFRESFDHLDRAKPLLEAAGDQREVAIMHRNRGLAYRLTGQLELARDELLEFRTIAQAIEDEGLIIESFANLSLLYQDLGTYDRGLAMAEQALTLAEQAGNAAVWTDAAINAATMLALLGRYDESLERWNGVIEQATHDGARHKLLEGTIGAAHVHNRQGDVERARAMYQQALEMAQSLDARGYDVTVMTGLAHSYERTDPHKASEYYERALDLFEGRRNEIGGAARTSYLSGERRFVHEEVARFYASLDAEAKNGEWAGKAFSIIERAKARGLLEQLQESVAGQSSDREAEILDAMYALTDGDPSLGDLEKEFLQVRAARVEAATGELGSFTAATIKDVQTTLPKKSILLQYAMGDTTSLLWAVDRKDYRVYELPNRAKLKPIIARFRDAVIRPGAGDAALRNSARQLYGALLAPAEDVLKKNETVVIVPDGALFEVPFEALLTQDPNGSDDWSDEPFFARRHATIYTPSASVFVALASGNKRRYQKELLAVGDADFATLAPRPGAPALDPLPYTRDEVVRISANVEDDEDKAVLLGEDARESSLKRALRSDPPRVLHLATHGLVDAAEPSASSIVLGADDQDDGYLYTLEILAEPMNVQLVVVSACESGRGKLSRSEGVVGLSRAFIASGAAGVVSSLWAVSDQSTAELMTTFYSQLYGKKHSAPRALNDARLALLDNPDYAHPFYWSPFIVVGGPSSMRQMK